MGGDYLEFFGGKSGGQQFGVQRFVIDDQNGGLFFFGFVDTALTLARLDGVMPNSISHFLISTIARLLIDR